MEKVKNEKLTWTDDQVEFLIDQVMKNPRIWDASSTGYKNKGLKHITWVQITTDFNINFKTSIKNADLVKKWNNLKHYYATFKQKDKSGASADDLEEKVGEWKFLKKMSFLSSNCTPKESFDTYRNNMEFFNESQKYGEDESAILEETIGSEHSGILSEWNADSLNPRKKIRILQNIPIASTATSSDSSFSTTCASALPTLVDVPLSSPEATSSPISRPPGTSSASPKIKRDHIKRKARNKMPTAEGEDIMEKYNKETEELKNMVQQSLLKPKSAVVAYIEQELANMPARDAVEAELEVLQAVTPIFYKYRLKRVNSSNENINTENLL